MASADFCAFSTAFGSGYVFQRLPHRPPWVPHVSFTPSTCLIYPMRFRVAIGLYLVMQTCPRMRPYMRFLFVRPELCPRVSRFPESSFLQILSRDRYPCLRLCPSRYRADSGLTPVRNVRRQAHIKKRTAHRQSSFVVSVQPGGPGGGGIAEHLRSHRIFRFIQFFPSRRRTPSGFLGRYGTRWSGRSDRF